MGESPSDAVDAEKFILKVDERGRLSLPKQVRERLGIESNDEIHATLVGSVLEIEPKPSSRRETATAGRKNWENSTPTDTGETLFGSIDE